MFLLRLRPPSWLRGGMIAALAVGISCCGDQDRDFTSSPPPIAVLSAFPAELAAYLGRATIGSTAMVNGHVFRIGVLERVPVVVGLTGIGLVNAATTVQALLEQVAVQGIVFSGVASSTRLQIGDVAVPAAWGDTQGATYAAYPPWFDLAAEIAGSGAVTLERCTTAVPSHPEEVCVRDQPVAVVGGVGHSSDPFGGLPFACQPGGSDVFGCDVESMHVLVFSNSHARNPLAGIQVAGQSGFPPDDRRNDQIEAPAVDDMETAAVAREAAARGLPFIAFRAVSDGPGDPLGLGGFPAQFFAYYHLAARNAAAATLAFVEKLAAAPASQ